MDQQTPGYQADAEVGQAQPPVQASGAGYSPVPTGQPDLAKRFIAVLIDGVAIVVAAVIVGRIVGIASGYLGGIVQAVLILGGYLLRDVLVEGRSLGKKVMGLNVVTAAGGPITPVESIKRNITLSVGSLGGILAAIVPLLGAIASIPILLVGAALGLYEAYLVVTNQQRMGDKIAGTKVIVEGQPAIAI